MSTAGRRQERLAEQIRIELSEMIARDLKDPRVGFATVTRVKLSADLHYARVLISVLGPPDEQAETITGLYSAAGFLRHEIGHRLPLRRVPELNFILDQGAEEGERIELLLREIHKESAKDRG